MLGRVTPEQLKEKSFQKLIKEYLIEKNNYWEGFNKNYDNYHALDKKVIFEFLEDTQPDKLANLKKVYGDDYKQKIIERLNKELARRSMIDVIKHGIKDYGYQLDFAYFKPPTKFNKKLNKLYNKNIFTVIEELNYMDDKRIDLVIFLNGLPIVTLELKNQDTGQDYKNAIVQYKEDRSPNEKLFKFKQRSIVNFAVDKDEVYMTTQLNKDNTFFLPFNKGTGIGKAKRAGNPEVIGKLKTHYLWEDILKKDLLLEILQKYVFIDVDKEVDEQGNVHIDEKLIFPRYHQLEVVSKLLEDVKETGSGKKYLIQHSAGSGKTYSITWLSHRLSSLHDSDNQPVFDSVIVVTDRVSLDQQLQDTIYQIDHKTGVVARIKKDSHELADKINDGTRIIISTIQKFPFILDKVTDTKDKRYAIIIDEAHSSTSGSNILALKESLSLEEAAELDQISEENRKDVEDKINEEIKRVQDLGSISIFGFTATPKSSTLELFGMSNSEGKKEPFHVYSMKQAIEEGFILDVLNNYLTYKMYYKVNKKIIDDPEFDKSRTSKEISKYVSLHPTNISQKTEIMIEHFRNKTQHKLNGEAKAMLVTSSRLHAVRYKLAFDKYIEKHDYHDLNTLVAFSGTVKEDDFEYTESKLNGFSDDQTSKEFDKDDYQLLLVANKFQTGFDQPKLHTMFVDKRLRGVNAVQTLSRLNRTYKGIKEDTFILDFVNDLEDIQKGFEPYYEITRLKTDNIDPNEMYTLKDSIYDSMLINRNDVDAFIEIYYSDRTDAKSIAIADNALSHSLKRINELPKDEIHAFKAKMKKFINLYMLIIQIHSIKDTELHKLCIYLKFVLKRLDIEKPSKVDISDKVYLEYYKLDNQGEENISLDGDHDGLNIKISEGSSHEEEKDYLSKIIERLNERFQTDFDESAKVATEQVRNNLQKDDDLRKRAEVNSLEDFKIAVKKKFNKAVVDSYTQNEEFYGRVLKDEEFKNQLMDLMIVDLYNSFNEEIKY